MHGLLNAPPPLCVLQPPKSFDGFRLVVLLPRYRPGWPAPGSAEAEEPPAHKHLGAPLGSLPPLSVHGKPLSTATIRAGPNFLEIPFVATQETKKGRGYGRCLLEAIEQIARCLNKRLLMLCSTDDEKTLSIWQHFGFLRVEDDDWETLGVDHHDMLYMENTVQLYKPVDPARQLCPVVIRHQALEQRVYAWRPAEVLRKQEGSASTNGAPPGPRQSTSRRSMSALVPLLRQQKNGNGRA